MIDVRTSPERYRHWRLELEPPIAWLSMDVDEAAGAADRGVAGGHGRAGTARRYGQVGARKHVARVDLRQARQGERPAQLGVLGEHGIEPLAFGGAEFFRIIQAGTSKAVRQDHGGGGHRAGERPPSSLVHAGHDGMAAGVQRQFVDEVGHGGQ